MNPHVYHQMVVGLERLLAHTGQSFLSLVQQQEFGMGSLQLTWPGHLQASPPHKEELTPAA